MSSAFFNQPGAAAQNFNMFCQSVRTWQGFSEEQLNELETIRMGFPHVMKEALDRVWMAKLGLASEDPTLVGRLLRLMQETLVDYTIFFRELSELPDTLAPLSASFYHPPAVDKAQWMAWLEDWHTALQLDRDARTAVQVSEQMKAVNPRYILREWQLVPAYKEAAQGDIRRIHELQAVMTRPYETQDDDTERRYYARRPMDAFGLGGVSHMSCSS